MVEFQAALGWRCAQGPHLRDDGHIAVISHPDGGLVCPDKTRHRLIVVVVRRDADLVLSSLRRPARHRKWWLDERHCAAIADGAPLSAYQRIDIGKRITLLCVRTSRKEVSDNQSYMEP